MSKIFLVVLLSLSLLGGDFSDKPVDLDKLNSFKTRKSVESWLNGNFGLKPHHVNYVLPFGFRERPYESSIPQLDFTNIEAQLQVSLKLMLTKNHLGLGEKYYIAYTQRAFWQLYINSSPFRESLYSPEAFVAFPINDSSSMFGLRSLTFGYKHESNGQPDTDGITFESGETLKNFSRSLDYFYLELRTQHNSLVSDFTLLAPFDDFSDNPGIMDYRGHTQLKLTYFVNEHMFTLMGRGNLRTQKGAVETTYSYPLLNDANFYVKIFSGYGESLIDYNRELTKYSIGFSFSR